jgi:hypothetical protein
MPTKPKAQPAAQPKPPLSSADMLRQARSEARKLRDSLTTLTTTVMQILGHLDNEMKKPSTVARGRRIAVLCNHLEIANDSARYFGLGIDYRTDQKPSVTEADEISPIVWTGDLSDDCVARWRDLSAHAEKMDERFWYCSVTRWEGAGKRRKNISIFHTSDDDVVPLTGEAARKLCEFVMRATAAQGRAEG